MGRHSTYTPERGAAVCARLAEGESLTKAAAAEGISYQSVLRWTDAYPVFADEYARAREAGYRRLADEILDISDASSMDAEVDDDGNVRVNAEVVARSRLRVDSRKWLLSKMLPKIYGDKLTTEVNGTLQHDHTVGLQPETARLLDSMRAGSGNPGAAPPVPD